MIQDLQMVLERTRENLGKSNRRAVLSNILLHEPLSRKELAQRTGLTNASISRISREFIEAGLVKEKELSPLQNRPGRRLVNLHLNPAGGRILGIGINALEQYVTLANLGNQVIEQQKLNFDSLNNPQEVLLKVAQVAQKMLDTLHFPLERIFGCGVAITGAVDPEAGAVLSAPNIGWKKVAVRQILEQNLKLPVQVENIPNAINFAETRFGIVRGYRNVLVVNASLGIGCSLLLDNHLIRGHKFAAGLIGQSRFWHSKPKGEQTIDAMTGGWRVLKEIEGEQATKRTELHPSQQLNMVLEAAAQGDAAAQIILQKTGTQLGKVIETIVGVVHPECVVLSGPLAHSHYYLKGVQHTLSGVFSEASVPLLVSKMTSSMAARWLAMNEFLIHRNVDLWRLTHGRKDENHL